jgi:prevent-host-death family protein
MTEKVSQRELRNDNAELMRRVEAGESFTVTRRGVPLADLIPHREQERRALFIPAGVLVDALTGLPAWDVDEFGSAQREFDQLADDDMHDPWP